MSKIIEDKLEEFEKEWNDSKSWSGGRFGSYDEGDSEAVFTPNTEGIKDFLKQALEEMEKHTLDSEQTRIAKEMEEVEKHLNSFFDWTEQIKAKEIERWVMMYGISPDEFKRMILSIIKQGK